MIYRVSFLTAFVLISLIAPQSLNAINAKQSPVLKQAGKSAERAEAAADEVAPRAAVEALEAASALVVKGDTLNSILEYRRAFELAPSSETAVQGYVQQVSRLGAISTAIKQHSEGLAKSPNDLAARLLLAELLRSEFRFNDALDHYWLARRRDPTNPVAIRGVVESLLGLGLSHNVGESLSQLAGREGKARVAAVEARLLLTAERPEAALARLSERSTEVNQDPSALLLLADVYRALAFPEKELAALRTSLALQKQASIQSLARLARAAFESKDNSTARTTCEEVLKLDPRNVTCAFGLSLLGGDTPSSNPESQEQSPTRRAARERDMGEAALFWNQPARALPHLQQALTVWADSPRILLSLGTALLLTGDADGAASTFARITDNRNLNALLLLAQAKMAGNKPEQALAIYRYVLDLEPENLPAMLGEADALRRFGDVERVALSLTRIAHQAPENNRIKARLRGALTAFGRSYKTTESANSNPASGALVGQPRHAAPASSVEPVLEVGDKLKVRVTGKIGLDADAEIDENGFISLPFIAERIPARCSTIPELQNAISERGGTRLAGATLELNLTAYSRLPLIVAGAVYLPGKFNIRAPLSLREALMLASGATPLAGRSVHVLRGAALCDDGSHKPSEGRLETYERNALESNQMNSAQPLRAGDLVVVSESNQVFITGAVARPAAIAARSGLTLLKTVESLGGTTPGARRDDVRLLRLMPDGAGYQKFSVSLGDIEQSRVGDVVLRPGDIIEVHSTSGTTEQRPYYAFWREALRRKQTVEPPVSVTKRF